MKFINKQIELLTFQLEFVRLIQSDLLLSESSGRVLELTHPGIAPLIKKNRENIGHIWTPGNHKPSQSYVNILASKKVDKKVLPGNIFRAYKHRSGPRNSNSSFKAGSRSFSASRFACKNVVNEVRIYIFAAKCLVSSADSRHLDEESHSITQSVEESRPSLPPANVQHYAKAQDEAPPTMARL